MIRLSDLRVGRYAWEIYVVALVLLGTYVMVAGQRIIRAEDAACVATGGTYVYAPRNPHCERAGMRRAL